MNWVIVLSLIGGCLATPLQQGNLKVYRYNTNRDGIFGQNEGIPVAPQPIIYNPQQPFMIQEPAPLTYSSVRGSALSERDEQRHINVEDEIEAREEVAPEDQSRPVEDVRVDSNDESKEDSVRRVEDQKPVQTENAALLGSSVVGVKGRETVQPATYDLDLSHLYSGQLGGQRRLVEPQPQVYGVKSVQVQPQVVYQAIQHQVPISVEEQRINVQDLKKPVIQYQTVPIQNKQPYIPREWTRPVQVQPLSGVKGGQKQTQWYIQPVIPSDISVLSQSSGGHIGSQQIQPVQLQGIQQQAIGGQPQVITIPANLQGIRIQQREQSVQGDVKVDNDLQGKVEQGSQSVGGLQEVQDLRQSHVQQQERPEVLSQTQGKSSLDQSVNKVVVQTTSQRQTPVVGGHRVVSYQLGGHSLSQQIPIQQQLVSPIGHQQIQYSTIPVSDLQQYYQLIQNTPLQTVGIPNNRYISYTIQNPSYVQQPIQHIQYQTGQLGVQHVGQIEQGVRGVPVQTLSDNVQRVQVQELRNGQDLRVNPLSIDQRQQRSFRGQSGVKGSVNV